MVLLCLFFQAQVLKNVIQFGGQLLEGGSFRLGQAAIISEHGGHVFRQLAESGHVSQLFHPADLIQFVKLTQVLR
jgi:hypothetical protein